METLPSAEEEPAKLGAKIVSFTAPEAYQQYWWFEDAQGQPVLRFGEELLGKDF